MLSKARRDFRWVSTGVDSVGERISLAAEFEQLIDSESEHARTRL